MARFFTLSTKSSSRVLVLLETAIQLEAESLAFLVARVREDKAMINVHAHLELQTQACRRNWFRRFSSKTMKQELATICSSRARILVYLSFSSYHLRIPKNAYAGRSAGDCAARACSIACCIAIGTLFFPFHFLCIFFFFPFCASGIVHWWWALACPNWVPPLYSQRSFLLPPIRLGSVCPEIDGAAGAANSFSCPV